jgi:type II restriction/modification system DNA methylase subunit YeeA
MMIIEPVVLKPVRAEWETAKAKIEAVMARVLEAAGGSGRNARRELGKKFDAARAKGEADRDAFIDRLCSLRILDPACGSGNFLYLALQGVKDIEWRAILDCEALGLGMAVPRVGPEILHGIEINPFAAELARTTVWIGDIQWRVKNAISHHPRPLLRKLDSIECRDALLTPDGKGRFKEAEWPEADFIIGNPPFLGDKKMIGKLTEPYVTSVRSIYRPKLRRAGDLVCFWFAKAWDGIQAGRYVRAGFVATNSIRSGSSNEILRTITKFGRIFEAWDDEPWVVEGAAVRVSLICFDHGGDATASLDGHSVSEIYANLTAGQTDITRRESLHENMNVCFVGVILNGEFELPGILARDFLRSALNVNGRPNSDVLRPTLNGDDFNGRRPDKWVIDFGTSLTETEATLYERPFGYIEERVKPFRHRKNAEGKFEVRAEGEREIWWRHARSRKKMREAIAGLDRYIATPMVSSYRIFDYLPTSIIPDQKLVIFSRDDYTFFGILQSSLHRQWTVATCSWIGAGNDVTYSNTAVFETFPFPEGLTPNIPAADTANDPRAQRIAAAAKRLDELRRAWLNPPDLVDIVPEVTSTAAPGEAPRRYPDRILPKTEEAAVKLRSRTLTNLYNEPPRWLADAHETLDRAVAAAYGWPEDISTDDALARLLALNLERCAEQEGRQHEKPTRRDSGTGDQ